MKKAKNIHNLDTLEREIYRLQLEVKNMEQKFDRNFDHLQQNYSSMFMGSFFRRKKESDEGKSSFFDSFFKNENFHAAVSKITDRLADKAAEGIENLVDKIFHKGK
jgi:hypothetical protein